MANELKIPSGTKLQVAFDVPLGSTPNFNMMCTFFKDIDDTSFLISIPMVGGKPLILDENQKFLIRYQQGSEPLILAAYPDDLIREGIRRYWKMRRVTESRQFFQRKDERLKVALKGNYYQPTWPLNDNGTITPETLMTLDISAGGVAVFLNRRFDVGEMLELNLPRVGIDDDSAAITDVVAAVCWSREAPKGSVFRFLSGLQFRTDEVQKARIGSYVAYIKNKYKL